jgi:NAD(P)H dehydrogenase (quinone)
MRVFIVFAHPEPRSFTGSMKDVAVETLQNAGHEVELSDLHAMGFNPVPGRHDFATALSDEFFSYEAEQQHAHAAGAFSPEITQEHLKLIAADLVLFIFPLWWFSMPAIMKGWVDRVFAIGFAYGGGRWYDKGVFRGKRAMLAITTGGSEAAYTPTGIQGDIGLILYPIQHGILQYVGMDVLPPFVAYGASYAEEEDKERVRESFRQYLIRLEELEPLPLPSVEQYDENLQLKEQVRKV